MSWGSAIPMAVPLPLITLLCVFPCDLVAQPDGKDDLERILQAWAARRNSVQTARITLTGTKLYPKGVFNDECIDTELPSDLLVQDLPSSDLTTPVEVEITLDLRKGRVRKERREQLFNFSRGVFVPRFTIEVYDAGVTKRHLPNEDNKDPGDDSFRNTSEELFIVKRSRNLAFFPSDYPFLFSLGILVSPAGHAAAETVAEPLPADQLRLAGVLERAGRKLHIVRLGSSLEVRLVTPVEVLARRTNLEHEFLVDAQQNGAIVEYNWKTDGGLNSIVTIDYHNTSHGWMPRHWKVVTFKSGRNKQPWFVEELHVKHLMINHAVSEETFDIPLRPGMLVSVVEHGPESELYDASLYYKVSHDGKTLVPVPLGTPQPLLSPGWTFLAINLALVLLIGLAVFVWRKADRLKRSSG